MVVLTTDDGIYAYENQDYEFDTGRMDSTATARRGDPSTGESDNG